MQSVFSSNLPIIKPLNFKTRIVVSLDYQLKMMNFSFSKIRPTECVVMTL